MKSGQVFLAGDYAERLANGEETLPDEAVEGPYALGKMIMVSRDSLHEDYRLPELPEWFPARVCLPPPVSGQWYRWYDPFIWYETEVAIHAGNKDAPSNMAYVGKLWSPTYRPDSLEQWAYPIEEWRRLFGSEVKS